MKIKPKIFLVVLLTFFSLSAGVVYLCRGASELTHSQIYMAWEFNPKAKEYKHSGDFTEQVLIISDKIALFKYLVETNKLNFTMAQAEWSGTPEYESASGYGITKMLVPGIERISLVSTNKLLVDVGVHPYEPRYSLVDFDYRKKMVRANRLEDLPLENSSSERVWIPASVYFDKQLVSLLAPGK